MCTVYVYILCICVCCIVCIYMHVYSLTERKCILCSALCCIYTLIRMHISSLMATIGTKYRQMNCCCWHHQRTWKAVSNDFIVNQKIFELLLGKQRNNAPKKQIKKFINPFYIFQGFLNNFLSSLTICAVFWSYSPAPHNGSQINPTSPST